MVQQQHKKEMGYLKFTNRRKEEKGESRTAGRARAHARPCALCPVLLPAGSRASNGRESCSRPKFQLQHIASASASGRCCCCPSAAEHEDEECSYANGDQGHGSGSCC